MTSQAYQLPSVSQPSRAYVFRGPLARRLTAEQFADAISSITGEWRVRVPRKAGAGTYSRDWRLKSDPLTRALGRPIRDQVFTERNSEATMLQALEVVNGETMSALLDRGARRMQGRLATPPASLFDSGVIGAGPVQADIDIAGVKRLWLLLEDADSYDPARTVAGWVVSGWPEQKRRPIKFKGQPAADAIVMPLGSTLILDNPGNTRFQASVGVDESCLSSDISPRVRFFIFSQEPDRHQLVRVEGEPPVETPRFTLDNLYEHALARAPSPREREIAQEFLAKPEGLQDLLWSMFLLPEFQYIR